jgi:hypothetical protein
LTVKTARIPASVKALWGKPPLLSHEDPQVYWRLAGSMSRDVEPTCVIEWFDVKNVVDLTWEIIRLRRFKALIIELRRDPPEYSYEETEADEETETDGESEADPAAGTAETETNEDSPEGSEPDLCEAEDELDRAEKKAVEIFLGQLDDWERIDSLIASAEIRRAAALREIERRRSIWADRLRAASDAALGEVVEREAPGIEKIERPSDDVSHGEKT